MTVDEIRHVLNVTSEALILNKQMIDQSIIDTLRDLLIELKAKPEVMQNVNLKGDLSIDKLLQNVDGILNLEEKLIGAAGDSLIHLLTALQNKPIILSLLARFI